MQHIPRAGNVGTTVPLDDIKMVPLPLINAHRTVTKYSVCCFINFYELNVCVLFTKGLFKYSVHHTTNKMSTGQSSDVTKILECPKVVLVNSPKAKITRERYKFKYT